MTSAVVFLAAWAPTASWFAMMALFARINLNSPLAVVIAGGLIAGVFSIVNTLLNLKLIRQLEQVKTVTDTVALRKTEPGQGPHMRVRNGDH